MVALFWLRSWEYGYSGNIERLLISLVLLLTLLMFLFFTFDVNLHFMPGGKSICLMVGKLFLI